MAKGDRILEGCVQRWRGPSKIWHVCRWHRNGVHLCPCGASEPIIPMITGAHDEPATAEKR